jgi:hypothetical protein
MLSVFSGGVNLNPISSAFHISMLSLALNTIGNPGVYANPIHDEVTEITNQIWKDIEKERENVIKDPIEIIGKAIEKNLGDKKFWEEERCETFFGRISKLVGFGYCSWLKYCEEVGQEACIQNDAYSHKTAMQVLGKKIQSILPVTAAQSQAIQNFSTIQDCFSASNCPDIDSAKIHPRERRATKFVCTSKPVNSTREQLANWISSTFIPPEWRDVQEILRFRSDDPREKFLFISAEADHNGALDPSLISTILSKLSNSFDLKFQVVKTQKEICDSIENGKKAGNLAHVLISGHGNPEKIVLDADVINENTDFASCFSGIQPNGKIILLSCSTGKPRNNNSFDNIAQKMADKAKRVVVAPTHNAYPARTNFLSVDDAVLYHPESRHYSFLPFFNTNLFTSFRPNFKNCSVSMDLNALHQREKSAIDVIKTDLISKSLLHKDDPMERAQEYLQFCKDDPREKILVLSADYDKNGALEPSLSSKFLSIFADRFDLRYKVVKSLDEICQEVEKAAKTGKVVTLVIQAHGTPTDGMILSKDSNGNENRIKASDNFAQCFSKIEKDGTIVLFGSSIGQNGENQDNIAQKISKGSQRTVLATTCPIYPEQTTIQSINPLLLNHPGYSILRNFLKERCPENNENLFKTFSANREATKDIQVA